MSHIVDQANELRKRAIELLLSERSTIDEMLRKLAYDGAAKDALPAVEPRRKACSECGQHGHNARRCPEKIPDASGLDLIPPGTV